MNNLRTYKCYSGNLTDTIKNVNLEFYSTHYRFNDENGDLVSIWPLTAIIEDEENYKKIKEDSKKNSKKEMKVDDL